MHHWLGDEVKLSFYTEVEKESAIYSFDLVIETAMVEDSDGEYKGSYKITSNGPAPEGEDGTVEITGEIHHAAPIEAFSRAVVSSQSLNT